MRITAPRKTVHELAHGSRPTQPPRFSLGHKASAIGHAIGQLAKSLFRATRRQFGTSTLGHTELLPHHEGGLRTVQYTYSEPRNGLLAGRPLTGRGLAHMLPELANVIEKKQGFVLIRSKGAPSAIAQLQQKIQRVKTTALQANDNLCHITSLHKVGKPESIDSCTSWMMQVQDESLGMTIDVPVTEIELNDLSTTDSNTNAFEMIGKAMASHLGNIHSAWQDAPIFPALLCPENPRLAQLAAVQEEALSQQIRGSEAVKVRMDWITKSENLLPSFAATPPHFQGEESSNFETFYVYQGIRELPTVPLPYSIGAPSKHHPFPARDIRGFKRHLSPTIDETAQSVSTQTASSHQSFYKEPSVHMQCATQAANGFFQGHQVSSADMASHHLTHQLRMLERIGVDPSNLTGMGHPRITQAVLDKVPVTISRQEFMGDSPPSEICMVSDHPLETAWRSLVNQAHPDKNWAEHSQFLAQTSEITVTPSMWLSAMRGVDFDCLKEVINLSLADIPPERGYPARVDNHEFKASQPGLCENIEHSATQKAQLGQQFPVIVRTGASGHGGHYFTVIPDEHGNWYSLNSDGTRLTGQQPCKLFAPAGQLHQAFIANQVSHVLSGPL